MVIDAPNGRRYELVSELGRGGMGVVFLAREMGTGQRVAIKFLQAGASLMKASARFDREVAIMRELKHPNIVQILDCVLLDDGSSCMVMEYVEGESLGTVLAQGRIEDWRLVVGWATQILNGFHYAHERGIVHRDIKPDNIMLGRDGVIKIMDFGIARMTDYSSSLTMDNVIGTPAYMAPEQAAGKPVTVQSDLYSIGTVMYALLAGRPPFQRSEQDNPLEVLQRQIQEQPRNLAHVDPGIPAPVVSLVHRLLAKNPQDRPVDCMAVLDGLKSLERVEDTNASRFRDWVEALPNLVARLSAGACTPMDLLIVDFIAPGFASIANGKAVRGVCIAFASVGVLLSSYPFGLSLLLRAFVPVYSYVEGLGSDFRTTMRFLWNSRREYLLVYMVCMPILTASICFLEHRANMAEVQLPVAAPMDLVGDDGAHDPVSKVDALVVHEASEEVAKRVLDSMGEMQPESVPAGSTTPSFVMVDGKPIERAQRATTRELPRLFAGEVDISLGPFDLMVGEDKEPLPVEVSSDDDRLESIKFLLNSQEPAHVEAKLISLGKSSGELDIVVARLLLANLLERVAKDRYLAGRGSEWNSWQDELARLEAAVGSHGLSSEARVHAADLLFELGCHAPYDMTGGLLRLSRLDRFVGDAVSASAVESALSSKDPSEVFACLVLLGESSNRGFGAAIVRTLVFRSESLQIDRDIYRTAQSWLALHGTKELVAELSALLEHPDLGLTKGEVRKLMSDLEKRH